MKPPRRRASLADDFALMIRTYDHPHAVASATLADVPTSPRHESNTRARDCRSVLRGHVLDGGIVTVNTEAAVDVVRECAKLGDPRLWLFKGIGGAGAVSGSGSDASSAT